MKRPIIILTLSILLLSAFSKTILERHNFSVTYSVYDYQSADRLTYVVTYDSIFLTNYCGTSNCKDSFQYSKALTVKQADSYYSFIKFLQLDTLRNSYFQYVSDGSAVTIKINGDSLPSKTISEINYYPKPIAIDRLWRETTRLFPKKKKWVRKPQQ